jgi:hypothetical protein
MAIGVAVALELAGYALGSLGAILLFFEFFQMPSYVEYEPEFNDYTVDISPSDATEYTLSGRVGAFLLAVAFALEFFAVFLAQGLA